MEMCNIYLCMGGYVGVVAHVWVWLCICVCVYVGVYVFACVCVCMCVCAWGHVYMCIDTRGCVPDTCGCAMAYMSHVPLDTLYLTLLFTPSSPLHQKSNT